MIHKNDDTTMREDLGSAAAKAAAKAGHAAQGVAAAGADIGIDRAAGGLEKAAHRIRDRAEGDGVQAAVTSKAATGVERAARYLEDHDSADLASDLSHLVRKHPLKAVAVALFIGYLFGKAMRR